MKSATLCLYWLEASADIRDIRMAPRVAASFARTSAHSGEFTAD